MKKDSLFFCGIGGSGMSPLALLAAQKGCAVAGSDRSWDKGETPEKFKILKDAGIFLFPQDGSGVTSDTGALIVSSAVEESVPDVRRALDLGVPVRKRAALLADMVNQARGICVAGTSGKTTTTGMIAFMLDFLGFDPSFMNGGQIIDFLERGLAGNARAGQGDLFVTETDESDGSIALFTPAIAVLNNITLDHKPLEELRPLFRDFLGRAREAAIVNLDDPEAAALADVHPHTVTYALENKGAIITAADLPFPLQVPGRHNLSNALAALSVAKVLGIPLEKAGKALASFKGIKRRFEIVDVQNGVTVIDDFAHNPDKIAATLATLKETAGRVIVIFQPHGYGPTKMLKSGLIQAFAEGLSENDVLLMPEIYYAGGSANKTISSRDLTDELMSMGKMALFMGSRDSIKDFLADNVRSGDRIIVMGARDDTLSVFARQIVAILEKKPE